VGFPVVVARNICDNKSEVLLLKERVKERLEAAQMKFLGHLFVITELDKKRMNVLGKTWNTEHSKGNKTVPEKVATTSTEDGQKQNIDEKDEGT
jgi:hypothetical protein